MRLLHLQNNGSVSVNERLGCLWCGADNMCKNFGVTSVIPLQGVPCKDFKYNVGTCSSKCVN